MPSSPLSTSESLGLSLGTTREVDHVTVGVAGDIDSCTVGALDAVVLALIDDGDTNVVFDLSHLTFVGSSGLRAIADTSTRLAELGGALRLRSAPPMARRLLTITGMTDLVDGADPVPATAALGAEHRPGDRSVAVLAPPENRSVRLDRSGTVVLDTALRLVTVLVGATIAGADGASVTLERSGRMVTVASSDATVLRMDQHQYDTAEGPCLAAAAGGDWIHIRSLFEETRWPAFVPRAIEEGIASILSTPLIDPDRPVGALNIYSNTVGAFGTEQQGLAALFATQISEVLADIHGELGGREEDALAQALRDRKVIAQAQGVLMARRNLTADEAATTLHWSARARESPVVAMAVDVVASTRVDIPRGPLESAGG